MAVALLFKLYVFAIASFSGSGQTFGDNMEYLFNNLTHNYNRHLPPRTDQSNATQVCMSFAFVNLIDLEVMSGKFSVVGFFDTIWVDPRMQWNRSTYGDISSILLPQDMVWRPNLLLMNPYDGNSNFLGHQLNKVRFTHNGEASWRPGHAIDATCNIDVMYYPFDTQYCHLTYYVWDYVSTEIELRVCDSRPLKNLFTEDGVWTLEGISQSIGQIDDTQYITVYFQLKRKFQFFVINMLAPIFMTGILDLLVFRIHPESGERIGYSITVLLAIVVFLSALSDILPDSSLPSPPLISYLLLSDMCMGTCVMVCTIISSRIFNCTWQKIPGCLIKSARWHKLSCRDIRKRRQARKVYVSDSTELNDNQKHLSEYVKAADDDDEVTTVTWADIGKLFDFISFLSFLAWFILSHVIFASIFIEHYGFSNIKEDI